MTDRYTNQLIERLEEIYPGAPLLLDRADSLPTAIARDIVKMLLTTACDSQNVANITSSRRLLQALPLAWLVTVLPDLIDQVIDINNEWNYRRLIELLQILGLDILPVYIERGLLSSNADVRDAAQDFSA